jgi:hypothetical protein
VITAMSAANRVVFFISFLSPRFVYLQMDTVIGSLSFTSLIAHLILCLERTAASLETYRLPPQ